MCARAFARARACVCVCLRAHVNVPDEKMVIEKRQDRYAVDLYCVPLGCLDGID